jgi:hypothetical protein
MISVFHGGEASRAKAIPGRGRNVPDGALHYVWRCGGFDAFSASQTLSSSPFMKIRANSPGFPDQVESNDFDLKYNPIGDDGIYSRRPLTGNGLLAPPDHMNFLTML